jgi:hypothetical protein
MGDGRNFVMLTDKEGVASNMGTGVGKQPFFTLAYLREHGSTAAAHEFGHMLGYRVDKTFAGPQDPQRIKKDDTGHADRSKIEERYYIMSRSHDLTEIGICLRRVAAVEIKRLNQGNGIHLSRNMQVVQ